MSETIEPLELMDTVLRSTPPAVVTVLDLSTMYLSNTVYILTIIYVLFQIVILAPKVKAVLTRKKGGKNVLNK